jgi:hypothetical protein
MQSSSKQSVWCRAAGRACVAALLLHGATIAQPSELEREVATLQGRIAEARSRIEETEAEMARDRKAYQEYQQRLTTDHAALNAESDSLRVELRRLRLAADSVAQIGQDLQARQSELDTRQKTLVRVLIAACDSLDAVCAVLPPAVSAQRNALGFLRSELSALSVESGEALERLWHLHLELEQAAGAIDVYSETSPTPLLRGQVDLVRLGLCYLAAVDEQQNAAVWSAARGDSAWTILPQSDAAAVRTAVQVRRGSLVPQVVHLPVRGALPADTVGIGVQP